MTRPIEPGLRLMVPSSLRGSGGSESRTPLRDRLLSPASGGSPSVSRGKV